MTWRFIWLADMLPRDSRSDKPHGRQAYSGATEVSLIEHLNL